MWKEFKFKRKLRIKMSIYGACLWNGVQAITPEENCPPFRVKSWVKVRRRIGVGGQFSSGEIVLEPFRAMSFSRIFIFVNSAAIKNTIPG